MPGILEFQAEQETQSFNTVVSAIHEITQENVARVGWPPTNLEQLKQIKELSM
jgi:hypothetical protein